MPHQSLDSIVQQRKLFFFSSPATLEYCTYVILNMGGKKENDKNGSQSPLKMTDLITFSHLVLLLKIQYSASINRNKQV